MSTSPYLFFAAVFSAGLILFTIGMVLPKRTSTHWTQLIEPSATQLGIDEKRDLIERLGIIGGPWAQDVLRAALAQERQSPLHDDIARAMRELGAAE